MIIKETGVSAILNQPKMLYLDRNYMGLMMNVIKIIVIVKMRIMLVKFKILK